MRKLRFVQVLTSLLDSFCFFPLQLRDEILGRGLSPANSRLRQRIPRTSLIVMMINLTTDTEVP